MTDAPAKESSRPFRWWRRVPLTGQAIGILTLAVGPLLVSLVLLGLNSEKDSRLDTLDLTHLLSVVDDVLAHGAVS